MNLQISAATWSTAGLILLAVLAAAAMVAIVINRKTWLPNLDELVSMDSRGWRFVFWISAGASLLLVATSQMFGTAYWVGLAMNSDGLAWPETCDAAGVCEPEAISWGVIWGLCTITTISFAILSVIFELTADLGAPIAAALKGQGRRAVPEWLLVAAAIAIVMSLISKWGIYEDKRHARAEDAARIVIQDSDAQTRLNEAQKTIDALAGAPSVAIAAEKLKLIDEQLVTMRASKTEAEVARDKIPVDHSTNRNRAQQAVDAWSRDIIAKEGERLEAKEIEENAKKLKDAVEARAKASKELEALAGRVTGDGQEVTRIGDALLPRIIRVGLHQLLALLFPIIAFDTGTIAAKVRKTEEANARRSATMREKNRTVDAEFEDVADSEPAFGGYLPGGNGADPDDGDEFEPPEDENDDQGGAHA